MVRYPVTPQQLLALIAAHDKDEGRKKTWPVRSAAALKKALANPSAEITGLWSEIKPVYATLQAGKCGFCERLIGEDEKIANEQDVEHFRPKKGVDAWPPGKHIGAEPLPVDMPVSSQSGKGYLRLAFHELNYVMSCKTCNARFKANFFPIRGKHSFAAAQPGPLLQKEDPFLVHPLDGADADPEEVIGFDGFVAVPAAPMTQRKRWERGYVSVGFFGLNDTSRQDQLLLARARRLMFLGDRLRDYEAAPKTKKPAAWQEVQREFNLRQDHAGCVRAAIRLYSAGSRQRVLADIEKARVFYGSKMGVPSDAPPPP